METNTVKYSEKRVSQVNEILKEFKYSSTAKISEKDPQIIEARIDDMFYVRVFFTNNEQPEGCMVLNSYVQNEPSLVKRSYNDYDQLKYGIKNLLKRYESEKNFVPDNNYIRLLMQKFKAMESRIAYLEDALEEALA